MLYIPQLPKIDIRNKIVNPLSANPQNGQTLSNNSSAKSDELFECV